MQSSPPQSLEVSLGEKPPLIDSLIILIIIIISNTGIGEAQSCSEGNAATVRMSPSALARLFPLFLLALRMKGVAVVTLELGDPVRVALSGDTVVLNCAVHFPPNSTGGTVGVYRVAPAGGQSLISEESKYQATGTESKTETKRVDFIAHNASYTGYYHCRYTSEQERVQRSCFLLVRDQGYTEPPSSFKVVVALFVISIIFLVFSVSGTGVLLWKRRVCACSETEERKTERHTETERDTARDTKRVSKRDSAEKHTVKEPSIYTGLEQHNVSLYTTLTSTPKKDKNIQNRGGKEKKKKKKEKVRTNQPQSAAASEAISESVYEIL